jgi:hypothetical protein
MVHAALPLQSERRKAWKLEDTEVLCGVARKGRDFRGIVPSTMSINGCDHNQACESGRRKVASQRGRRCEELKSFLIYTSAGLLSHLRLLSSLSFVRAFSSVVD